MSPAKKYVGTVLFAAILFMTAMIAVVLLGDRIPFGEHVIHFLPLIFLLVCFTALVRFIKMTQRRSES